MENKILDTLNLEQKAAVVHTEGPLVVIAGAGTGKTKMLTHKIAYLVEDVKMNPSKILAVTFTNKAAKEMKERVEKLIGIEKADKITISTYHSLCARILRSEIGVFGYKSSFIILDGADQKQIISQIYKKLDINNKSHSYAMMLDYISTNKMKGISANDKIIDADKLDLKKESELLHATVYLEYEKELERLKALDFDDLILFVQRLFKEHENIAQKWATRYDYVLVDEYQDTSVPQYEIIKVLAGKNNITVVGDPDQTIYTWRQASIELINNFSHYFPGATTIKLLDNYRSTQIIIDSSNRLIKNNKQRVEKELRSTKEKGDKIDFYNAFSEDAEAKWIVNKINQLKKDRTQLKDIAIIYRAHYLSQPIEKHLINENINYAVYGGMKFYQRQEIKDAISYLRIIQNGDEVALSRMINVPTRSLGATTVNKLIDFSQAKKKTLYETIIQHFNELPLSPKQINELATFINLIRKYKKAIETYPIHKVIDKFLIEVKYYEIHAQKDLEEQRNANLKELIRSIEFWENDPKNKGRTLDDYIDDVSLMMDKEVDASSKDYVSLMTVHSAKGLEFSNVFIAGFSDSIFPSARSLDEEDYESALEEERRLAYVAMTRAKSKLFISNSRGYVSEDKEPRIPSRFIKEIGIDMKDFNIDGSSIYSTTLSNDDEDVNYIEGDFVSHIVFGQGVIVNVSADGILTINFGEYGNKEIKKTHKSIERVR